MDVAALCAAQLGQASLLGAHGDGVCLPISVAGSLLSSLCQGLGVLPCTASAAEDCSVLLLALPWDSLISSLYQLLRCLLLSPSILQHWKPWGDFAKAPGSSIPSSCSLELPRLSVIREDILLLYSTRLPVSPFLL